eukprot:Nitzschia sp. Nitz4//scaffold27_size158506//67509//69749//NITZ4_002598-RA/size158506-snap-gene-0.216-mRNA-1//-1//CDS//3329545482//8120//frame0
MKLSVCGLVLLTFLGLFQSSCLGAPLDDNVSCPAAQQIACGDGKIVVCETSNSITKATKASNKKRATKKTKTSAPTTNPTAAIVSYEDLCLSPAKAAKKLNKDPEKYTCGPCNNNEVTTTSVSSVDYPYLTWDSSFDVTTYNPTTGSLCIVLHNAEFDAETVTLHVAGVSLTPVINETTACVEDMVLIEGSNALLFNASTLPIWLTLEDMGPVVVSMQNTIYAGSYNLEVDLVDASGFPFLEETQVIVRLTDNVAVYTTQTSTTGTVTVENIPPRTVIIMAQGPNGEFGTMGIVGGNTATATVVLVGLNEVSSVDNKDFANGNLDGWKITPEDDPSVATVVEHEENVGPTESRRRLDISDYDMVVTTTDEGPNTASFTFEASDDACYINLRYRFETSEIPGGYYGSQFNDYYAVNIRSQNWEEGVYETGAMNDFQEDDFDSNGSTSWRENGLYVEPGFWFEDIFYPRPGGDIFQVDLVVANVADGAYDSKVYLDFVEEITDEEECGCKACDRFFEEEGEDTAWIDALPECPCSIEEGLLECTVRPVGSNIRTGSLDGHNWDTDLAMNLCCDLGKHPGAKACIRSDGPVGTNTRQQCCYDDKGNLILHGYDGAGTPDRYKNVLLHYTEDVVTYENCCEKCPSKCHKYIGTTGGFQGARSDTRSNVQRCPVANRVDNSFGIFDVDLCPDVF